MQSTATGRSVTSIMICTRSNQEVADTDEVRTFVVYLIVCRALELVIDPAIFIDCDNLFDEELAIGIGRVQVVFTNQIWPRSACWRSQGRPRFRERHTGENCNR